MLADAWSLAHEPAIRLGAFVAVFAGVGLWELRAPRRTLTLPRRQRWTANLGIVALNTALLRLLLPLGATGLAVWVAAQGWGLLNQWPLPAWLAVPLAVVALDAVVWAQHRAMHALPLLWRLHRVHHADPDYDLSTGARFHPLEILLSMAIKAAAIALLGAPPLAVLLFEVLLNATAMFNHGNIRLPEALDRLLRRVLVTPDMHRVHHSVRPDEHQCNFGFNLPWWDRLAGCYRAQPRGGHVAMRIGLDGLDDPAQVARLDGLLALPFRSTALPGPPAD